MLNTQTSSATWHGLGVPERVAAVIERSRLIGGNDQVLERNFIEAPETCDLSLEVIRANIGKATQLLEAEASPTYPRAVRIRQGAAALLGMLPGSLDIKDRLALHGFSAAERDELTAEIVSAAAGLFESTIKVELGMPVPPIAAWEKDQLARNAN